MFRQNSACTPNGTFSQSTTICVSCGPGLRRGGGGTVSDARDASVRRQTLPLDAVHEPCVLHIYGT